MMDRKTPRARRLPYAPLALALALALPVSAAVAGPSSSFAVTSFGYNANGGTLVWSAPDDYQTMTAWAEDAGGLGDYKTNTSTLSAVQNTSITSSTSFATATAAATAGRTISGAASAVQSSFSHTAQPNEASANTTQAGAFTLLGGSGIVTFNVGYTITLAAVGGNPFDNYSEGSLSFILGTYGSATGGTSSIDHASFDTASGTATYSGVFTQTVTFAGTDDIGFYNLQGTAFAVAPAAIPEPSDIALLFAGVGALTLTGSRLRRKDASVRRPTNAVPAAA